MHMTTFYQQRHVNQFGNQSAHPVFQTHQKKAEKTLDICFYPQILNYLNRFPSFDEIVCRSISTPIEIAGAGFAFVFFVDNTSPNISRVELLNLWPIADTFGMKLYTKYNHL